MGDLSLVRLAPWGEGDLGLLRLINTPQLRAHLGGAEPEEKLLARHRRYVAAADCRMFRVELAATGQAAGSVGYWSRDWQGEQVYESGWSVLPRFQGRGVATAAALAVIELARAEGWHRWLHAFPGVDNPASNATCRRAGFELVGPVDFEYPPGSLMRSHDWRYDLRGR
jgi:RimJ/RimL family protein N-acetyltransferase